MERLRDLRERLWLHVGEFTGVLDAMVLRSYPPARYRGGQITKAPIHQTHQPEKPTRTTLYKHPITLVRNDYLAPTGRV